MNMSNTTLCRKRGWKRGTRIVGDEGYGPTVIEITAVGEAHTQGVAKVISHNGKPSQLQTENLWSLDSRNWRKLRESRKRTRKQN